MLVCLFSSCLISPRVSHLEQKIHCFAYLKKYNCSKMVVDDKYSSFDDSRFFKRDDWSAFYPEAA